MNIKTLYRKIRLTISIWSFGPPKDQHDVPVDLKTAWKVATLIYG